MSSRSAVLAVDDERIRSRSVGDTPALERIYAADYQLITAEGVVRDRADQIGELKSGQLVFRPVELLAREVRVYSNTALVQSHERASIVREGREIGGELRMLRVYIYRDGRWQLVSTQATRIAH